MAPSKARLEESASAIPKSYVPPLTPPMDLARQTTKSARNLVEKGPSRKELQATLGVGQQVSVDVDVGLKESVEGLLTLLGGQV